MEHPQPVAVSKSPVRFQRQFHLVDLSDPHYRQTARSHIVKERFRELRWCGNGRGKVDSQQLNAVRPSSPISESTTKPTKRRRYGQRIALSRAISPAKDEHGNYMTHMECRIGLGSLDPFQALPVESPSELHLLVHHYTNVIPTLLRSSGLARSRQCQPAVDLFHLYCLHPASFLGMMYHSAHHRESLYNDRSRKSLALKFKIKTLQEVNRQIDRVRAQGTHPDNGTILAIYLLSVAERMWGDLHIFRLHWRAMYDIIDARGGADAFAGNDLMFAKVCWNCFALLNARDGYFNCPGNTLAVRANYDFKIPANYMVRNCHYFMQEYTERKTAVLRSLPATENEALFQLEAYPRRTNAFQSGTIFHRILHSTGNKNTEQHSHVVAQSGCIQIQGDRLRTDNCRLACIIYLNLLLMELGDFSEATESFLSSLEKFLTEDAQMLSPEYLLWILLRRPIVLPTQKFRGLWEKAIQIIAVVKRARYQNVLQYHKAMMLFLELPVDVSKLTPTLKVDLDTIQEEALGHISDEVVDASYFAHRSSVPLSIPMATSQIYSELFWFAGRT